MYRGIKYRKFDSVRPFGVELEASNRISRQELWSVIVKHSHRSAVVTDWSQTHGNRHWHIKTDSTCGPKGKGLDHGFEVASYKAAGLADIFHIAEVAGRLQEYGVQTNDNCGLHVHADASDYSPTQVGVFVAHWLKVEHFLFSCVPRRRSTNPYCRSLGSVFCLDHRENYTAAELWDIVCPADICVFENPERRVALNLMNYATGLRRKRWSRKTLELRLPEGTFQPLHVKNWTRFFLNFVDYCKDRPMPENICPCLDVSEALRYCGLGHDDDFYIFSPGLHETRLWLLERCHRFGGTGWGSMANNMLKFVSPPV